MNVTVYMTAAARPTTTRSSTTLKAMFVEHVHTNGIENFWSLLKRGLRGTYVSVEPFHLDAYVTEQVFRFNNRATKDNPLNDADRFALAHDLRWAASASPMPNSLARRARLPQQA